MNIKFNYIVFIIALLFSYNKLHAQNSTYIIKENEYKLRRFYLGTYINTNLGEHAYLKYDLKLFALQGRLALCINANFKKLFSNGAEAKYKDLSVPILVPVDGIINYQQDEAGIEYNFSRKVKNRNRSFILDNGQGNTKIVAAAKINFIELIGVRLGVGRYNFPFFLKAIYQIQEGILPNDIKFHPNYREEKTWFFSNMNCTYSYLGASYTHIHDALIKGAFVPRRTKHYSAYADILFPISNTYSRIKWENDPQIYELSSQFGKSDLLKLGWRIGVIQRAQHSIMPSIGFEIGSMPTNGNLDGQNNETGFASLKLGFSFASFFNNINSNSFFRK